MESAALPLWPGAALAVLGVAVLRLAWSRPRRSLALNMAGWALLLAATLLAGQAAGAWGIAVASLWAMGGAFVALAIGGLREQPGRAASPARRANLMPKTGEPRYISRRITTFLLVVLGGALASIALAIALRGLTLALGLSEADGNALALYAVPIVWSVLAFVLLMQQTRRAQVTTLCACCLALLPIVLGKGVS